MENNGFILFIGSAFICLGLIALPVFLLALAVALGLAIVRYWDQYIMENYYTLLVYRLIDQPESLNDKPMVRKANDSIDLDEKQTLKIRTEIALYKGLLKL